MTEWNRPQVLTIACRGESGPTEGACLRSTDTVLTDSLLLDACRFDHLTPKCRFLGKEPAGLGRRSSARLKRDFAQHVGDLSRVENLDRVAIDLFCQIGRRSRRRHQAEPGDRFKARKPCLRK